MLSTSLLELGWKTFFQQQVSLEESTDCLPTRIIECHRSRLLGRGEDGDHTFPMALLKHLPAATVGDWLLVDRHSKRPLRLLERQTLLQRKAAGERLDSQLIAANIDTLLIVSSCNRDFNPARLERYLSLALEAGMMPVVVLTKADLCTEVDSFRRRAEALRTGLVVECVNALDTTALAGVEAWCKTGQTLAMVGSSGVGKSSLANALGAGEQVTAAVREDDQRGRHTTTARSLHQLPGGGLLIDTPGMRELQLADCEDGVNALFADVLDFANCRFADCSHDSEPGCGVQRAIAAGQLDRRRLQSYRKLQAEQQRNSESLAQKRRRMKQLGKLYKTIQKQSMQRKSRD